MRKSRASELLLIIFVAAVCLFFFLKSRADPDLWGHLTFGQTICETRAIPRVDTYSYTAYGCPWINHEWLSEAVFYTVFKYTKDTGLVIFKFSIALLITLLIYKAVRPRTDSVILFMLLMIAPLAAITRGFAIRPQIFTNLFLAIAIFVIDRLESGSNRRWFFIFPPLFLFWCNLHGGFTSGLCVFLLYAVVKLFTRQMTLYLALSVLFSVLVTLINPYGVHLWRFLVSAISLKRPFITEWQMTELSAQSWGYVLVSLITVLGLAFSKKRRNLFDVAILAIALTLAFRHNRHTVLFAILAGILMPKYFVSFSGEWFSRLEDKLSRAFLNSVLICYCVFFILGLASGLRVNPLRIEVDTKEFPVEAVRFLSDNGIKGNIFQWFNWGEMCIRELKSSNKVFIDGRYETVYNNKFIHLYFAVVEGQIDYNEVLTRVKRTDIMFLDVANGIIGRLARDGSWILVYSSPAAVIFLKDNENNREALKKFRNKKLVYPKLPELLYFE